ncbi:MAG TPA: YceH family protein [Pyrinomonadaceae bacterium]|nr:YceH family protein [Pyrinomonadaceae bacterium]
MTTILSDIETRVLGSLVEKQVTTPEYYPLTLNALTVACNQKNNRSPVTSYSDEEVSQALESLREKNLAYVFYGSTSRVPKYKHVVPEVLHLNAAELAIMCVLMLRGAQTPGELRGNGARFYDFSGLEEVEQTLNGLMSRDEDPLVARLPRQPGQKEVRFMHLLNGEIPTDVVPESPTARRTPAPSSDRVSALEQEVASLKSQVEHLQQQFDTFKKQFE